MSKRRIIVTSALPYANGDIHLGHLVEYVQTDFWVRYQKLRGNDCVYICADDTHGTPIMIRARKEGITPEQLIARSHETHLKDFTDFQVSFDNYYTTNSPENKELSERIYAAAEKQGFITKKTTPQLYCEHCKMFLPDRFVKGTCPKCGAAGQYGDSCDHCGATYGAEELGSPVCTTCGGTPVVKDSEHLYFELEPQHDYLEKWIPGHTTSDVSNKLLEWFKEPLRGWCISRDAPYFGFEIPGYKDKYFYVWVDAPIGYIASLKNWCAKNGKGDLWNDEGVELYHFIGKDIIRFHCLFWPGMLHAAGFKGPNKVFVHGFLTVNGEKMSKSKGTFVNARTYLDNLPPEALRYYYAAKLGGTTDDMDLNLTDFVTRVKPLNYMPYHGEFYMMQHNAEMAENVIGLSKDRIIVADDGDIVELLPNKTIRKNGRIPVGNLLFDDADKPVHDAVVKDRIHISREGIFVVVLTLSKKTGHLVKTPDIVSRAFVYLDNSEELIGKIRHYLRTKTDRTKITDQKEFKEQIKEDVTRILFDATGHTPIVIPVINLV